MVSAGGTVTLQEVVEQSKLSAAGMVAWLPQSPRYVADEFDVPVYAHTGPSNFALKGWSLSLQYDPSVLTLVQQQFSSVYQAPTYASDASAGKVDLVTTGISSAQTNADVQGKTALYLMTLRLDKHHWFFAEGIRVHNKGGGGFGGGGGTFGGGAVSRSSFGSNGAFIAADILKENDNGFRGLQQSF